MNNEAAAMEKRLTDLEPRFVRGNLMFYGIKVEGDSENCGQLVKITFVFLHIEDAQGMLFDLAHRVGQKFAATRPIVVKFHYCSDREKVRQALFN